VSLPCECPTIPILSGAVHFLGNTAAPSIRQHSRPLSQPAPPHSHPSPTSSFTCAPTHSPLLLVVVTSWLYLARPPRDVVSTQPPATLTFHDTRSPVLRRQYSFPALSAAAARPVTSTPSASTTFVSSIRTCIAMNKSGSRGSIHRGTRGTSRGTRGRRGAGSRCSGCLVLVVFLNPLLHGGVCWCLCSSRLGRHLPHRTRRSEFGCFGECGIYPSTSLRPGGVSTSGLSQRVVGRAAQTDGHTPRNHPCCGRARLGALEEHPQCNVLVM
jgi:hypothetical protein